MLHTSVYWHHHQVGTYSTIISLFVQNGYLKNVIQKGAQRTHCINRSVCEHERMLPWTVNSLNNIPTEQTSSVSIIPWHFGAETQDTEPYRPLSTTDGNQQPQPPYTMPSVPYNIASSNNLRQTRDGVRASVKRTLKVLEILLQLLWSFQTDI